MSTKGSPDYVWERLKAKLSADDQYLLDEDIWSCGNAYLNVKADGSVVRVAPERVGWKRSVADFVTVSK